MKGLLCACLLVSLQSITGARAYEADIHYSATYALARASGWPAAEAVTIASANQGVDENEDTVAALEVDTTPGLSLAGYLTSSLHQAEKNLRFHCFGSTSGPAGEISADVRKVISDRFAEVPAAENARRNVTSLIALGVALHCQQDAYSHVDFSGSCGSYSGSCYGHTYETILDQVAFGLLKKHLFNPDHPAVSGRWLLKTLQGTANALAVRRPKASMRSIATNELVALSNQLRNSGVELPDDVRRECNRYIAGKWLHDYFQSRGGMQGSPERLEQLAPKVADTCKNELLGSATIVRIPAPRFPRLNPDASPIFAAADGTYQLIRDRHFGASPTVVHASANTAGLPNHNTRKAKLQLSNWSQFLALPPMARVAFLSADSSRKAR